MIDLSPIILATALVFTHQQMPNGSHMWRATEPMYSLLSTMPDEPPESAKTTCVQRRVAVKDCYVTVKYCIRLNTLTTNHVVDCPAP